MRRHSLHPSHLLAGLAVAGLVLVGATPAGATGNGNGGAAHGQPADGADKGGSAASGSDSSTSHTEDNDTNDGGTKNNLADDGDNKHPSGKDRSVENGKSGNQGKATSDPDDDGRGPDRSNGGPDKANGAGGADKADQDGNNGCGNDDDFEDDNEGWCGRKPTSTTVKAKSEAKPESKPETNTCPDGSMTRPCSTKAKTDTQPDSTPKGEPKRKGGTSEAKACPNGSMTRPCTKTDSKPGNGTADITVAAECRTVTVTSSKDISNVVVSFADGTSTKFDGLTGHRWTRAFDKNVASATAKSATTVVKGMANGCAAVANTNVDVVADDTVITTNSALAVDDKEIVGAVLSGSTQRARGAVAEFPVGTASVKAPAGTVSARSNGQPLLAQLGSGVAAVVGGGAAAALAVTGFELLHLVTLALALTLVGAAVHWRARQTS